MLREIKELSKVTHSRYRIHFDLHEPIHSPFFKASLSWVVCHLQLRASNKQNDCEQVSFLGHLLSCKMEVHQLNTKVLFGSHILSSSVHTHKALQNHTYNCIRHKSWKPKNYLRTLKKVVNVKCNKRFSITL